MKFRWAVVVPILCVACAAPQATEDPAEPESGVGSSSGTLTVSPLPSAEPGPRFTDLTGAEISLSAREAKLTVELVTVDTLQGVTMNAGDRFEIHIDTGGGPGIDGYDRGVWLPWSSSGRTWVSDYVDDDGVIFCRPRATVVERRSAIELRIPSRCLPHPDKARIRVILDTDRGRDDKFDQLDWTPFATIGETARRDDERDDFTKRGYFR